MRKIMFLAAAAILALPVAAGAQEVKSVIVGTAPAAVYFDG